MRIHTAYYIPIVLSLIILGMYVASRPPLSENARALETGTVTSTYTAEYAVNTQNKASVTIQISFTNTGSVPTVLTVYDLQVGEIDPEEIVVTHDDTDLSASPVATQSGNAIRIMMDEFLLRVGETYVMHVTYTVQPFLGEVSSGYQVELPLFEVSDLVSVESISLTYPSSFGPVQYSSVLGSVTQENGYVVVVFDEVDSASRLLLSIGDARRYSVLIEQAFENTTGSYIQKELLIPPDTETQQFILTSISPFPSSGVRTIEGNYILTYDVPPGDPMQIRLQGILVEGGTSVSRTSLSSQEETLFTLVDDPLVTISDTAVLAAIDDHKGLSVEHMVDWVYQYTVDELALSQDFKTLHGSAYRRGADISLSSYKEASVEDYADVFVSLARYLGVPSRIVCGYVFPSMSGSNQEGMFHVWPQYWDSALGWQSVDPALEEYAHLQQRHPGLHRVITSVAYDETVIGLLSGVSSEISLTDIMLTPTAKLEASGQFTTALNAGRSAEGTLVVRNEGNVILHDVNLSPSTTNNFDIIVDREAVDRVILPNESIEIPFAVSALEWYETGPHMLSLLLKAECSAGTQRVLAEEEVDVVPLWWVEPLSWLITVISFIAVAGVVWTGWKLIGRFALRRGVKRSNHNLHTVP